jgi:DNA-binding beta-propeller fold protein YncE
MRYLILFCLIHISTAIAEPDISFVECKKLADLKGAPGSEMKLPSDVLVGPQGRIYVVDSGNRRILVYSSAGKYLFSFATEGNGPGELASPVGIAVAKDGRVLVADRGNKKIQIYNRDGGFVKEILTKVDGKEYTPIDVAVDSAEKRIYVSVSSPFHQLFILDNNGKILSKVGKPGNNEGEFRYPATMAVSPDDEIYVVDVLNTRAQVFDRNGQFLVTVGSWGVTQGQLFRPKGVALTKNRRILVSDSYLGVVQLYSSDTRFQGVLAMQGDIARFTTPVGMAVDSRNRIYIAEAMANRVSICQLAI